MRELGKLWDRDREAAREAARSAAYIIAAELSAHGVDFSFAPVLDLDYGSCAAIGDRALHFDPNAVGALGACIVQGFAAAGMAAVGKHFPGHGFAPLDSHVEVPRDDRPLRDIFSKDVLPYARATKPGPTAPCPPHGFTTRRNASPPAYSGPCRR